LAVQQFTAFPVVHHQAQQQQQPQEAVAGPGHDANDNNAGANGRNNPYKTTLSPKVWTLYELWAEYDGIGGRKAAKLFTDHERG